MRWAIERTVARLRCSKSILRFPFRAYARAFIAITAVDSRRSELAADAVAARICGAAATASALRNSRFLAAAFDAYWTTELVPALNGGMRPPVAAGYQMFLSAPRVERWLEQLWAELETDQKARTYATHPSLATRLAALPSEDPAAHDGTKPAISLLRDLDDVEAALLLAVGGEQPSLRRCSWEQAVATTYAGWFAAVTRGLEVPPGTVVADLADLLPTAGDAAHPDDERHRCGVLQLACALGLTLLRGGWAAEKLPGHPCALSNGTFTIRPVAELTELTELTAVGRRARWLQRCDELGIGSLRLVLDSEPQTGDQATSALVAGLGGIDCELLIAPRDRGLRLVSLREPLVAGWALLACLALAMLLLPMSAGAPSPQRAAVRGGGTLLALLLAEAARRYRRRVNLRAKLRIDRQSLTVSHPQLLAQPYRIPLEAIRVLAVDDGTSSTDGNRFPVYGDSPWETSQVSADFPRGWIWSDHRSSLPYYGLQRATPNLAILLERALPGPQVRRERLHGPLNGETVTGLLLDVDDLAHAEGSLKATNRLRRLRLHDLTPPAIDSASSASLRPRSQTKVPLERFARGDAEAARRPTKHVVARSATRGQLVLRRSTRTAWMYVVVGVAVPVLAFVGAYCGWHLLRAGRRSGLPLVLVGGAVFALRLALWIHTGP